MRKWLCIFLIVAAVLSLSACASSAKEDAYATDPSTQPTENAVHIQLEKFLEEKGDALEQSIEAEFFGSSNMTGQVSMTAVDSGVEIRIFINELSDVTQEKKSALQEIMDASREDFVEVLTQQQQEVPGTEFLTLYLCDKDGSELASITIR